MSLSSLVPKKTICVYVENDHGGNGDYTKACKIAKQYQEIYSKTHNVFVASNSGTEDIARMAGNKFNIPVKNISDIVYDTVDLYVECPAFDNNLYITTDDLRKEMIRRNVPCIFIPEYQHSFNINVTVFKNYPLCAVIPTGFGDDNKLILPTMNDKRAEEKKEEKKEKKEEHKLASKEEKEDLPPLPDFINSEILRGKSLDDYGNTTETGFEYSHAPHSKSRALGVKDPYSCRRYLRRYICNMDENKQQDILCVGRNKSDKTAGLMSVKKELIKLGFDEIVYVELVELAEEKNMPHVIHKTANPTKRFRLLHIRECNNQVMINLMKFAKKFGMLAGVTGDESLMEALQLGFIIVYECYAHKEDFAQKFLISLKTIANDPRVHELAKLLLEIDLEDVVIGEEKSNRIKELLKNKAVVTEYLAAVRTILENSDIRDTLDTTAKMVWINRAIALNKIDEAKKLIIENKINILETKYIEKSIFIRLLEKGQLNIIDEILSTNLENILKANFFSGHYNYSLNIQVYQELFKPLSVQLIPEHTESVARLKLLNYRAEIVSRTWSVWSGEPLRIKQKGKIIFETFVPATIKRHWLQIEKAINGSQKWSEALSNIEQIQLAISKSRFWRTQSTAEFYSNNSLNPSVIGYSNR